MKRIFLCTISIMICFLLVSCRSNKLDSMSGMYISNDKLSNESYLELNEFDFVKTTDNNLLNISMDSSSAGYSNIRRLINNNYKITKNAVNIEQMLNYFNYDYINDSEENLKAFTEVSDCPWNKENKLLTLAIKAKEFELDTKTPNNFVFLLDVSGSMYSQNKLPLMIEAFKLLIDNLNDNDRISIVTYAGNDKVLLDGGYGHEKTKISAIISDLEASGSTAGSKGIESAYNIASKYFIEGGNNRIFLATDGDFNVGISSINELKKFISKKRQTGIYLSLFGFGEGNLKSSTMDTLAQAGNGNYYYIDSILEAQKVFVSELGGTLQTVAKDTKAQIQFNKNVVDEYRLIGYENKVLTNDEFENSETDAGEIGAGHTTICVVELKLKENINEEILKCIVKYKTPNEEINKEITSSCSLITENPSTNFVFASSVVEFGLILRDSKFKGNANCEAILARIDNEMFRQDQYKNEFCDLIKKYMENNKSMQK